MTTFLLTLYFVGLGLMLIGLMLAPAKERRGALFLPTMLVYLFWPLSMLVVVGFVAYENATKTRPEHIAAEHAYS
jgi:hypothetical protein